MTLIEKESKKFPLILTNIVFALFPLSFILGNLITNINLILFCLLGIYHLKSKSLKINFSFSLKIIFLFFFIVFVSTTLSFIYNMYLGGSLGNLVYSTLASKPYYDDIHSVRLIKSILFFRFFIMLSIIYLLIESEIIDFKYFFLSATFLPLFISFDLIYQYLVGFNIIGLKSYIHHNTSFFGDELIAGGYVKNFSFFSILYLNYLLRNSNNYLRILFFVIATCTLFMGIMVSGNRMPFILFFFGLVIVFFSNKKMKKIAPAILLFIIIILGTILSFDKHLKDNYLLSFFSNAKKITFILSENFKNESSNLTQKKEITSPKLDVEKAGHKYLFITAIETWKMHKFFGNGIKSFREDCKKVMINQKKGICSNHPHNYYLEILTDLGILGFLSVILIAILFMFFLIKNFKLLRNNKLQDLLLLSVSVSLFTELFPLRSTGSIFTTNNATYIALLTGIILSYKKLFEMKTLNNNT